MNRNIRKLAAAFLALVLLLAAFPGQMLISYAATGKITFSDPSASVGNQVSVTMKIAASDGASLGKSDVMLEYDASALEFISGTNSNGGAGSIRVVGAMESANQSTFSFTLKFKALKAGTTSITVKSQEVYDADSRTVEISHVGNSAVKVNAPENSSKDASLASLTVSPGKLEPEFSADVTEYTATVSESVDKITVSAPANDSKASVAIKGNDGLQMGENTVVCEVTAEDGETKKTYTITVTKVEGEVPGGSDETPDSTEAAAPGGEVQNVEDGNWQVEETMDEENLPEGFTVTDYEYNGSQIQAAVNAEGVVLFYMKDEDGNGDYFVYDSDTGLLAPYVTVRMAEKTIIVLPPEAIPEGESLPENFMTCTIDIGSHTVDGWIWIGEDGTSPEYCIVYGQNAEGERNYYRYDQKEMTLQRFFEDPDAAELRTKIENVIEEYNSLVDDYKIRGYIIAGLFGACILLVIIMIILLLTRKSGNTYDDGYGAGKRGRYDDDLDYLEPEEDPVPVKRSGRTADRSVDRTQGRSAERTTERTAGRSAERTQSRTAERSTERSVERTAERVPARTAERTSERTADRTQTRTAAQAPKRPVRRESVEDMERGLADSLAREAGNAAVKQAQDVGQRKDAADDDFEFIDLDI